MIAALKKYLSRYANANALYRALFAHGDSIKDRALLAKLEEMGLDFEADKKTWKPFAYFDLKDKSRCELTVGDSVLDPKVLLRGNDASDEQLYVLWLLNLPQGTLSFRLAEKAFKEDLEAPAKEQELFKESLQTAFIKYLREEGYFDRVNKDHESYLANRNGNEVAPDLLITFALRGARFDRTCQAFVDSEHFVLLSRQYGNAALADRLSNDQKNILKPMLAGYLNSCLGNRNNEVAHLVDAEQGVSARSQHPLAG